MESDARRVFGGEGRIGDEGKDGALGHGVT